MSLRWLHLRLSAPLMAFGGVAIDHVGPTRDFPSASALTGLFGNALGWQRTQGALHQALQDRLEFGALIARQGSLVTDTQNAKLEGNDRGWTTWGRPDERAGATYDSPHRRRRDYLADHDCRVVLRLMPGDTAELDGPDLDALAAALDRPARPLFIGRKPCLPTASLVAGWVEGEDARAALAALGMPGRAIWPQRGEEAGLDIADLRNWISGLHGGNRRICEGDLP